MGKLRWILLLLLLVSGIMGVPPVHAQGVPGLAALEIDLWPEFDRPEVLVIYKVTLSPAASLPATLILRMPTSAGAPFNVAYQDGDGRLYNLDYETAADGPWLAVSFTTPTPQLQFEYYDPGMVKEGAQRTFTYQWPGDYAVDNLSIQVQQPVGAQGMQITPSLGAGSEDTNSGMVYYTASLGAKAANQTETITFSYQKENDQVSQAQVQVEPVQPVDAATPGRTSSNQWLLIGLAVIGLLMVVGGGLWWYLSAGHQRSPRESRRRHEAAPRGAANRAVDVAEMEAEEPAVVFCHQCGKRSEAGDLFCRVCGTRLRRE